MSIVDLRTWRPLDLQDLLIFNGLFTLILLPGSFTNTKWLSKVEVFAHEHEASSGSSQPISMMQVLVIFNNKREDLHHSQVALSTLTHMKIYVAGKENKNLYECWGIGEESDAAILIRPDMHTAMITPMTLEGYTKIFQYILCL